MDVPRMLRTAFSIGLFLSVCLTVHAQSHAQLPAYDVYAHSFGGHSGSINSNRQFHGNTHIPRHGYQTEPSPSTYFGGYGGVHGPKKKERVSWWKFLGDKINIIMGGREIAPKKPKKTWKQIVQENMVEDGIQHYLGWHKCNTVLVNVFTKFLRNSRLLELAVEHVCAGQMHKLLSPILDPLEEPVYAGIERRVGPEASKKSQGHTSFRG